MATNLAIDAELLDKALTEFIARPDLPMLTTDRDFSTMAPHTGLSMLTP